MAVGVVGILAVVVAAAGYTSAVAPLFCRATVLVLLLDVAVFAALPAFDYNMHVTVSAVLASADKQDQLQALELQLALRPVLRLGQLRRV